MRKVSILLSLLTIVFVGCSKQVAELQNNNGTNAAGTRGKRTEIICAGAGDFTKTTYTGTKETVFHWQGGDKIAVLYHNGDTPRFYEFTAVSTTDSWVTATFSGDIDEGYSIGAPTTGTKWALYPYDAGHTYTSDTDITFNMPAGGNGNTAKIPMIAKSDDGVSFQFHHLCGALKMTFTNLTTSKIKAYFAYRGSYYTSGKFKIQALDEDVTHPYIVVNQVVDDGNQSIETYVTADVSEGTAVAYIPIPLSGSIDGSTPPENRKSIYWAAYKFKVEDANKTNYELLPEYTVGSGSMDLYKGRITPIASKSLAAAITIDGNMSDWASVTTFASSNTGRIREWKIKSDANFVYLYLALRKNRVDVGRELYIGFETDNNSETGENVQGMTGQDVYIKVVPFTNAESAATLKPVHGIDASSKAYASGIAETNGVAYVWDYDDGSSLSSDDSNAYIEFRVPRSKLYLPAKGTSVTVNCAYQYGYLAGAQSYTME